MNVGAADLKGELGPRRIWIPKKMARDLAIVRTVGLAKKPPASAGTGAPPAAGRGAAIWIRRGTGGRRGLGVKEANAEHVCPTAQERREESTR